MRAYIEAKAEADTALERSGLDFTIVRPGGLSDDEGSGKVRAGNDIGYGQIARADVAATLAAALSEPATIGKAFDLLEGETPVQEALRAL